jgi:hypothetical protein
VRARISSRSNSAKPPSVSPGVAERSEAGALAGDSRNGLISVLSRRPDLVWLLRCAGWGRAIFVLRLKKLLSTGIEERLTLVYGFTFHLRDVVLNDFEPPLMIIGLRQQATPLWR